MCRSVPARDDAYSLFRSISRWKHIAIVLFLSGALNCSSVRSYAAGLECPVPGPETASNLLTELQAKLVASGSSADLANEINDLINKLQILKPNISYTELTDAVIAAFCPVVADMKNLSTPEKWARMRQFDTILQGQLAASMLPAGTLIVANVPLPPPVYRELRSQAASVGQTPTQLMATILSKAAGK
jgi:hypothetical protein